VGVCGSAGVCISVASIGFGVSSTRSCEHARGKCVDALPQESRGWRISGEGPAHLLHGTPQSAEDPISHTLRLPQSEILLLDGVGEHHPHLVGLAAVLQRDFPYDHPPRLPETGFRQLFRRHQSIQFCHGWQRSGHS